MISINFCPLRLELLVSNQIFRLVLTHSHNLYAIDSYNQFLENMNVVQLKLFTRIHMNAVNFLLEGLEIA